MGLIAKLIMNTATTLIFVLEVCMLIRAVLSWFPIRDDHPIAVLLFTVTEPVIFPFRRLFDRMGWFRNLPLDMPFLFACLVLAALGSLLQTL